MTGTGKGAINIPIGDRAGEAYDAAALLRSELKTYFIDAEMKFNADGTFSIKEHGK